MDASTPAGTWYLMANGFRLELLIQAAMGGFSGSIKNEGAGPEPLDNITWNAADRWLEFRRNGPGFFQWYRISITYGVMAGRFSHGAVAGKPALTSFAGHVTGWSPNWIDSGIVPRTWNLAINTTFKAVLRIDRDANKALVGRLKVFANGGALAEELDSRIS